MTGTEERIDELVGAAKRIEVLFAATQVGQVEAFEAWMEAAGLLIPIFDELRGLRTELERSTGGWEVAIREAARAREALKTINEWATTTHGGAKSPADIWPGLRAALDKGLAPEETK